MEKRVIPIVLSADDNYVPMLGTAIYSVISNASKDFFYKFHVLYTDISEAHKRKLKTMETENAEIILTDISRQMAGIKRESSIHLSIETVYRLFIPELFPQYEKIIYLDCDLVANSDISEFYSYDTGENILGAVHDCLDEALEAYWRERLDLSPGDAFNAGVLLINTEQFIKNEVKDKCFHLLQKDWASGDKRYLYMDQDVLNLVCRGKVSFLPMQWNVQWLYRMGENVAPAGVHAEEYNRAQQDIKLLHFSSRKKPWSSPEAYGAEVFWRYARQTVFYEELLKKTVEAGQKQVKELFERFYFPYDRVKAKSSVILYGAGNVGRTFREQMKLVGYCRIVLWVDKNYKKLREKGENVFSPDNINGAAYDYLIIAVQDEETASAIKAELIVRGLPEEKIVWESPVHHKGV